MNKLVVKLGYLVVSVFGVFTLYTVLVWAPVNVYAESVCLSRGYPEYKVSVGLSIYCINLTGSVSVAVDELKANALSLD